MTLREYCTLKNQSTTAFVGRLSKRLKVTEKSVYNWLKGKRPRDKYIYQIMKFTKGAVTLSDWPERS